MRLRLALGLSKFTILFSKSTIFCCKPLGFTKIIANTTKIFLLVMFFVKI